MGTPGLNPDELGIEIPYPARTLFHRTDNAALQSALEHLGAGLPHDGHEPPTDDHTWTPDKRAA